MLFCQLEEVSNTMWCFQLFIGLFSRRRATSAFKRRRTRGSGPLFPLSENWRSPLHQRRLYPSSTDWAKAETSIKRAAKIMTPARLKGYDRWRPIGMDCAAVQDSRFTSRILRNRGADGYAPIKPEPPGEVVGFVILGLTEEALRYCDVVFTSDHKSLKLVKPSHKAQKEGSG